MSEEHPNIDPEKRYADFVDTFPFPVTAEVLETAERVKTVAASMLKAFAKLYGQQQ